MDSFILGIFARRRLISFSRLREECAHEEARLVTREENMGETEDQTLTIHTKYNFKKKDNFNHNNKKDKKPKKTKRDTSNVRCYTCDEKGHFARYCPIKKRRHPSHVVEDDEQQRKYSNGTRMIQMNSMC